MINIAVIGYGYWGPNLVRNFAECDGAKIVAVSDLKIERLALAGKRFPGIQAYGDCRDALKDPNVDAVVIATPVSTHFEIAMAALKAGKHVLLSKPMTETLDQALRLTEEADRRKLVLMVDHTFVYTGAVQKIRELTASGDLGEIYYYDSMRINLGLFQHDVNVIWDLAVHDVSILDYILPEKPVAVSAIGMSHIPNNPENIAYLTLFFQSGTIAHINVNWLAPLKVRQTLVGGSKKMIVYDDLEPSEKIRIYDKGVSLVNNQEKIYEMLVEYRIGDMWAPQLERTEALGVEAAHFVDCIVSGTHPRTDGEAGVRVVKVLDAATRSIAGSGLPIDL